MRTTHSPESPLDLAVCRITIATLILRSEELWRAQAFASAAAELRTPAEGLGWAVSLMPLSEPVVVVFQVLLALSAALTALGLFTRWALGALALTSVVVFALPHFAGSPRHSMHVVWFVVVLAFSHAGRVASVDWLVARWRGRRERWGARERWITTRTMWTLRALLAVIYFFPGMWKLIESGFDWALSDNLQNQMYWKWAQFGSVPEFRPDHYPRLLRFGALGVLLLELGFPLLLLNRWTRLLAALLGFVFHEVAATTMYLGFSALWWCYVVLIDWAGLLRFCRRWRGSHGAWLSSVWTPAWARALRLLRSHPAERLSTTVQLLVLGACVVQGARGQMRAYPFACYPTFQWQAAPRMPDLRITLVVDGKEYTLPDSPTSFGTRTQYRWGSAWRAMGVYDGVVNPELLAAYLEGRLKEASTLDTELLTRVSFARFYRVDLDVRPGHWNDPAPAQLLAEVPLRTPP